MPAEKTICLVAQPRSGTNHLCRLMQGLTGIHVYLEAFNHVRPHFHHKFSFKSFEPAAGATFSAEDDPKLIEWLHQNPGVAMEILRGAADPKARAISIKIFVRHLSMEQFESTFANRNDSCFLIVQRRPIDAYISFQKALQIRKWLAQDTTGIRLRIDPDEFAEWHRTQSEWYRLAEDRIRRYGRPISFIRYETDVHDDDVATLKMLVQRLASIGVKTRRLYSVRMKHQVKLLLDAAARSVGSESPWSTALGLKRQDLNHSTAEKITNSARFLDDLAARYDSRMLDDYFVSR